MYNVCSNEYIGRRGDHPALIRATKKDAKIDIWRTRDNRRNNQRFTLSGGMKVPSSSAIAIGRYRDNNTAVVVVVNVAMSGLQLRH